MSWNAAFSWALLAWFVTLAIAEALDQRRERRPSTGDARLVTNFTLGVVGVAASSVLPLSNVGTSFIAQRWHTALLTAGKTPWLEAFVLTLMGLTLVSYWTHRAMHALPLFWRVHRVHHADTAVDVSTSLRHHPLEMIIGVPADWLLILLVGAPVSTVIAAESFILATALLSHAEIALPKRLDRAVAWLLVTPRVHRIHHHPERKLHDSNYGDTFTVWDRLFGTFTDLPERLPVGLAEQVGRPDHLVDQLFSPLLANSSASLSRPALTPP